MKKFYLILFLSITSVLFSFTLYANINGGMISLENGSLLAVGKTCLNSCNPSYSTCYKVIYNNAGPTGGSGQFIYTWEQSINNGVWSPISGAPSASSYSQLQPPQQKGLKYYYRRKVKDQNNLLDSAYSNSVYVTTWTIYHGYLQFSDGNIENKVAAGTLPLKIKNSSFLTDNYQDSYCFFEAKIGAKGSWQTADYFPVSFQTSIINFQPSSRNTADTVYYRSYIENSCGDYDTTYTNIVKVIFLKPITFSPGIISTPNNTACPGTPIRLSSTPTTAPTPYTSSWEYSNDSATWLLLCGSCDSAVDNNFTKTRYYRRTVTVDLTTRYSNVLKVVLTNPIGDPSVFGNNNWRFYNYNGTNLNNPSANIYKGYYTRDSLDINTATDWADTSSPSSATGYLGCPVSLNSFTTVAKRIGFDTGSYQINTSYQQGTIRITKNDSIAYTIFCCGPSQVLNLGKLGPSSKIEIRFIAGTGASSYAADFIRVGARPVSFVSNGCKSFKLDQFQSAGFVDLIDSNGAPVAAVNSNSQNFPFIQCQMQHSPPGSANIPVDTNGVHFMPRYFNFESSYGTQSFGQPIIVRLYFLNSEFNDYKIAANKDSINLSDLRILHYDGINEDCEKNNNASYGNLLTPISYDTFGTDGFYLDVEVSKFSEFGVTANFSTLPVSFINISAFKSARGINIDWEVAESPKDGSFDILRSNDGLSFTKLASVESKYSAEPIRYTFTDETAQRLNHSVYYRISQKDQNGKITFSKIVSVKNRSQLVTITPNPVLSSTTVKSSSAIKQLIITDVAGKIIKTINANSNMVNINLSSIPKGIYMVNTILLSGESEILRIVKD